MVGGQKPLSITPLGPEILIRSHPGLTIETAGCERPAVIVKKLTDGVFDDRGVDFAIESFTSWLRLIRE